MERCSTQWRRMVAEKRYLRGWRFRLFFIARAAAKLARLITLQ